MSRQRSKPQRLRDLIHTPVWVMNLVLKYPSIASVPLSSIDLRLCPVAGEISRLIRDPTKDETRPRRHPIGAADRPRPARM